MTAVIGDSSPGARAKHAPGLRWAGGEVVRGRAAEQKFVRDLHRLCDLPAPA